MQKCLHRDLQNPSMMVPKPPPTPCTPHTSNVSSHRNHRLEKTKYFSNVRRSEQVKTRASQPYSTYVLHSLTARTCFTTFLHACIIEPCDRSRRLLSAALPQDIMHALYHGKTRFLTSSGAQLPRKSVTRTDQSPQMPMVGCTPLRA
jgi:hypothetical protein